MTLHRNLILDVDSYKASHDKMYPPNTTYMSSYLESRGGRYPATIFFGLQYLLKEYLSTPITLDDVCRAKVFFAQHGEPFNEEGWNLVVTRHGGFLPVEIRAVPEGALVPTHNILMSVESTDPDLFWVVSWLETMLVRLWYPITVATQSYYIKQNILRALQHSADNPVGEIDFKLHDFGGRGVSSRETAGIGGMSHLVNFLGSDTVEGVRYADHYYNSGRGVSGFSIPASEHSTITMWGRERESDAYKAVLKYLGPGKTVACVSDSYDLYNVLENIWCGSLLKEIQDSGGTLVIRPDSGDPVEVVVRCLQILERKVGMQVNSKGFKVLPSYLRLIQGDGVNQESIDEIYHSIHSEGYSSSNISFGSGGALLQKLNRDTQKFAYKCSQATVAGKSVKVFKDPATDPGKKSKSGYLSLVRIRSSNLYGGLRTIERTDSLRDLLQVVFRSGYGCCDLLQPRTFEDVRATANKGFGWVDP